MTKRISKLGPGDRSSIRWLVGRIHVAETDEAVRENITKRANPLLFTPGYIKAAGDYAVKVHHENQGLVKRMRF